MTELASLSPDAALLEVEGLAKTYAVRHGFFRRGSLNAVSKVSFQVKRGETLALVGESGCGKTTIGRCILRLINPDGGTIRFYGRELQQLSPGQFRAYRKHLQMVFQDPLGSFNPMMKIGRALLEPLRLRDELNESERRAEVVKLLEQVRLEKRFAGLYPRQMSGGQLQRVGIARAIASQPELVFLDEPTSALDMSIRGQIVNLLLDLQQDKQLSYVLVTHDLRLVRSMANRVLVMYLGEVVEEGGVNEIFSKPLHPYTRGLLAATLIGQWRAPLRRVTTQLKGEVLALWPEYRGCKLYSRCPFAQPRCAQEPPVLREVEPERRIRCWRVEEIQTELATEVKNGQNTLHQP
jgi:oligopeptide/dipeptide ABC transporter ATP-binding protein